MEKNIKFCTKCGRKFEAVGREVICPACKAQAAEESRKAAVLRAKRASWAGESVPVRISGRASTVIREYGAAHNLPFAQALDELLKSTPFFVNLGVEWATIVPYKSRRMKQDALQEVKQAASKPQVVQAAKVASKPQDVPQDKPQDKQEQEQEWINQIKRSVLASKASKASTSKAAKTSKAGKATKTSSKK